MPQPSAEITEERPAGFRKLPALLSDLEFWLVLAVWIVHFLLLGAPYPLNYDSVNLALAIEDSFNINLHQPQPPGFLFQVMAGRLIHLFVTDPFLDLEILGLIYLAVMLLFLRSAPRRRFGDLLFCGTTPLFLFFTGAPVMQSASVAFGAGIAWFIARSLKSGSVNLTLLAGFVAFGAGFRYDILMTLGPAVVLCMALTKPTLRQWGTALLVFVVITASWYIPTVVLSNGVSPLRLTMEMQRHFTSGISVVYGGSVFENVRCAVRFLLYFPGVFGLGGCLAFAALFSRKTPVHTAMAIAAIVPFFLMGIILYMPLPQYYAPIAGFCMVFMLLTRRVPFSRTLTVVAITANLLLFWLIPRPIEPGGRFQTRDTAATVKKQLSFIGANGAAVLLYNNELMRTAEKTCAPCERVYASALWERIGIYMADRRWHNRLTGSADSADCLIVPAAGETVAGRKYCRDVRIERVDSCKCR